MARTLKNREPAWPRIELEGELIGYFATEESGTLHEVRQLLHDALPEEERARMGRRDFYCRTYRMYFCGGNWQGEDAAKVPNVMRGGYMTLEFYPDGVALRVGPFSCEPIEGVEDDAGRTE